MSLFGLRQSQRLRWLLLSHAPCYLHTVLLCLNLHSNLLYWIASNHTSKFAHAAYWLSASNASPPSLLLLATAACGICYNSYAWLIMSPSPSPRFLSFPHWYQAGWPPFGPLTRLVLLYSACFVLLCLVINEPPLAAFNKARLSINLAGACSDSGLAWRIHVPFFV